MKKILILAILISFLGLNIFAQSGKCVQRVWIEDDDPKGTNIRDAPSIKGKIIDVIPRATDEEPEGSIDVVAYSNGWLKTVWTETVKGKDVNKFGWISAKKVGFAIEVKSGGPAPLYSSPSRSSKKIAAVSETASFTIIGIGCFGFKISYKGKIGWLWEGDTCGNPLTTCA